MIRRVRIKGYKSLRDVEVELNQLTVCIGPNAAGKSNLFDALSLLSRIVASGNLDTAFEEHRGAPLEAFYYGRGGLASLLNQKTAQFTIEVDVELSPELIKETNNQTPNSQLDENDVHLLRYSLTVEMQTESGALRVIHEELIALNPETLTPKPGQVFLSWSKSLNTPKFVTTTDGSQRVLFKREDEVAVSPVHYLGFIPGEVIAFSQEVLSWHFYHLEPQVMRATAPLRRVSTITSTGENLAAFYKTLSSQQHRFLEKALRTLFNIEAVEVDLDKQGLLQMSIVEEGTRHSIRVASEGTLRVLALLAIVSPLSLQNTTVIGYEEPENGVHPRRLKLIADLFKNVVERNKHTQVLINTHSPVLPSYFEPESFLICRKQHGETRFIPLSQIASNGHGVDTEELPLTSFTERVIRGDFDE
jgi:predicted ATPase